MQQWLLVQKSKFTTISCRTMALKKGKEASIQDILSKARSILNECKQHRNLGNTGGSSSALTPRERQSKVPKQSALSVNLGRRSLLTAHQYDNYKQKDSATTMGTSITKVSNQKPVVRFEGDQDEDLYFSISKNNNNKGEEVERGDDFEEGDASLSLKQEKDGRDDSSESDEDDSKTFTPPSITESYSAAHHQRQGKGFNNKLTTRRNERDGDYYRESDDDDEEVVDQIESGGGFGNNKPHVFVSQESHSVFKLMADNQRERQQDITTPTPPSPIPLPQKRGNNDESYASDFVSDVQSVADEFSNNFVKSISPSVTEAPEEVESSIEMPKDLDEVDFSQYEADNASVKSSFSLSQGAVTSAQKTKTSLLEIKGNLQSLVGLDIAKSINPESEEEDYTNYNNPNTGDDISSLSKGKDKTYTEDFFPDEVGEESTLSKSKSISNRTKEKEQRSTTITSIQQSTTSMKSKDSKTGSSKSVASSSTSHGSIGKIKSGKPHAKEDDDDKYGTLLRLSEKDIAISRKSSRKALQEALSKVMLLEEEEEEKETRKDEGKKHKDKVGNNVRRPRSKSQNQIQAILEREVYRKELNRLRKLQEKQDKEIKKLKEAQKRNYQVVQEREQGAFPIPKAGVVIGLLNQGPSPSLWDESSEVPISIPDEKYIDQVNKMDVSQLVKEVVKSNERMYKMTLKAARAMSKEYRRNHHQDGNK